MEIDLEQTDHLLSTTRSVRRRLDFERPVPREVILDCIRLAVQAPTGGNAQGWRWMVVDDPDKKLALAELYRKTGRMYLGMYRTAELDDQTTKVIDSADYLLDNLEKAPAMVIPLVKGRLNDPAPVWAAAVYGSILPAVWSFQLALRARGLGSCFTTLHLAHEDEAAELLGIPDDMTQTALLPVAYTKGTEFKPAARGPVEHITHFNSW